MTAVRSVLLSEIQSVLSLARHQHGYSVYDKTTESESPLRIFQSFSLLRERLVRCDDITKMSCVNVITPFLDIIRHAEVNSSILTSTALQSVMNFMQLWPWAHVKDQSMAAEAVSDIVDAVNHCKFQKIRSERDHNVVILVVHVLHTVVCSPCGARLSDHSMWQLVESLYAFSCFNAQNNPNITLPLRSLATTFLHNTIVFIFTNPAIYSGLNSIADVTALSSEPLRPGFGLPCAVKIVGFLCQKLHQRNHLPPSTPDFSISSTGNTTTQREVWLSFSLLERALIACDTKLMTNVPSLMLFIKDDLCSAILRYCRLGACAELEILVKCLALIRLLWSTLRSHLRMQVEAIFEGVFYFTLHWCLAKTDVSSPDFPRGDDEAPSTRDVNRQGDDRPATIFDCALDEFSGKMLSNIRLYKISYEILDCLVDLLANTTLLPDLYVNYDCVDNRCDLTQNLFELLSQTVQQSYTACFESYEKDHFLWAQAIGEIALRGMFNALNVMYLRTHSETSPVRSSSSAPSDEENVDALLIHEEGRLLSVNSEEFASAEVLLKKRQRKKIFQHGIQEFNRKPLGGIRYLQRHAFLPTPLNSMSLAMFLRSLPQGMSKDAVGMYLGAMGKEVKGFEKTEIHEADVMDFHRDVLTNFVQSFNFEGESIVAALRMFLASFRLPGESQQIDRILNTFSRQVYEQCRERYIMASVDVAYLLSFSLIMLNTDLHNANIRTDKKMKLADFIKNNKNYGQDVSKGLDLPEDFLTELYSTIAENEIKTFEDGGKHGEVTSDRWKDLLNQAESDPRNSRLIVHHSSLHLRSPSVRRNVDVAKGSASPLAPNTMRTIKQAQLTQNVNGSAEEATVVCKSERGEQQDGRVPFYVSSCIQYDRHIYELIQQSLVRAFSSVFQQFVANSQESDATMGNNRSAGSTDETRYVPPKSALQLACNGLVLCAAVSSRLSLVEHCNSLFIRMCKYTALLSSDIYPAGYNGRESGIWVYCENQSAPIATAAVLQLLGTCSLSLHSRSWKTFFHVVNGLREFSILPSRILYPSGNMKLELMAPDERLEFINLVYQNKEELERTIALRSHDQAGSSDNTGGFFSGIAWLLSSLDASLGNSAPPSITTTSSRLSPGFDWYQLSPAKLASYSEDLMIEGNIQTAEKSGSEHDLIGKFGTSEWIRMVLQPYRLEHLMEDIASLPSRVLAEVIEALDEEILLTIRGPDENKLHGDGNKSTELSLSQGGCVLFEHLLSQIIWLSGSLCDSADEDGISAVLDAHYTQLLTLLQPVLVTDTSPNGWTYENACFLLSKSINGLFAWVTWKHSDVNGLLLVNFLDTLMKISDDDELIRPFLTPIMCGLNRCVTLGKPNSLHYSRMHWLTIFNLISRSVRMPHAASHAFGLLEQLVTAKLWNGNGNDILISDCCMNMIMFAMKVRGPHDSWPPSRPIDLLLFMFDTLRPDTLNYIDERLRFLGGMTVILRHFVLNGVKQERFNNLAWAAVQGLKHMLYEHIGSEQSFEPVVWLDILRYGLVPVGFDLLTNARSKHVGGAMHFGDDEKETNAPFLYYWRQLSTFDEEILLPSPNDALAFSKKTSRTGQSCRPLPIRDSLSLQLHVVMAQLLSLIVCEELTKLQTCPQFLSVWEDVVELLVGLLEHTKMENPLSAADKAVSGKVLIAALERRSVLSAHEEILEHSRGIVRRLAVLQDKVKEQDETNTNNEEKATSVKSSHTVPPDVLMQVLEERCRCNSVLLEQFFPAKEDAGSIGGRSPPVEKVDGEICEAQSGSELKLC